MRQKVMDRGVAKHIRKSRRKERQDKQAKKTLITMFVVEKLVERKLVKQQLANFIIPWSSSIVKEARNKFHSNFKASLQAHPLRYRSVNLDEITQVHEQVQQ
jgi:hypothetical protein